MSVEWSPYVNFFYGHGMTRGQAAALNYNFPVSDDVEFAFECAWLHHQQANDHHWQNWLECNPVVTDASRCQCWNHLPNPTRLTETKVRYGDDGTAFCLKCLTPFPAENVQATPMSEVCRKEMVADWRGAGRALGKPNTWEWYEANKDKMRLHPETRAWVEKEMKFLEQCDRTERAFRAGFYG